MKKSFFKPLEKDIKITNTEDDIECINNHYVVDAETIRVPEYLTNYNKHSKRSRKIKDIPYDGMSVTIQLKHQRFLNKETNETVSAPLDTIIPERNMTYRLYEYCVHSMKYNKIKNVSKETGVSERNLYYILENWLNSNVKKSFGDEIFIYRNDAINKDTWILIDLQSDYIIGILRNSSLLIDKIVNLNYKKVIIPFDLELFAELTSQTAKSVCIDNIDIKCTLIQCIFDAYLSHRKKIEKFEKDREITLLTSTVQLESKLFFKETIELSHDEKVQLLKILKENEIFKLFYEIKKATIQSNTLFYKSVKSDAISYEILENSQNILDNLIYSNLYVSINPYIIKLQGMLKTLQKLDYNIFDSDIIRKEKYDNIIEDFNTMKNILTDSQFLLRWNSVLEDKKR